MNTPSNTNSSTPSPVGEGGGGVSFDAIRPFNRGEMPQALDSLLRDRQFQRVLRSFAPWLPKSVRNGLLRLLFCGLKEPQDFQERIMKPVVKHIIRKHSKGITFGHEALEHGDARYTFISNHRDIVLDSAFLDLLLFEAKFKRTVEIAIGDNLLIYPWIKTLVRLNKAFTVRRGLSPRELLQSSLLMSQYIHHAVTEKHENIWIAQREGRAKDSDDRTQDSVLKMLAMGGVKNAEGSARRSQCRTQGAELKNPVLESLRELNLVPLTISYEFDPCDYLKAKEFQQKRDNPAFKKSKQDDLDNMKTGIFGDKGHVHYQASPCINTWIDELVDLPKTEFFAAVAKRIDQEIHKNYKIFPINYVCHDLLAGDGKYANKYTAKDKKEAEDYLQSRIDLIDLPQKDVPFLRERLLTMYANPLKNKESAAQ